MRLTTPLGQCQNGSIGRPAFWLFAACLLLAQAGACAEGKRELSVLTWNLLEPSPMQVLLDRIGVGDVGKRVRGQLALIARLHPDIIALQEVSSSLLKHLHSDSMLSRYHTSRHGDEAPPGGLLLLSRYPLERVAYRPLPSRLGRYWLQAKVITEHGGIWLAVVHLDSELQAVSTRKAQLNAVVRSLPSYERAIWLGDFNFGDRDPETKLLRGFSWMDVWQHLKRGEGGVTYDVGSNPLAADNSYTAEGARRLDRVLLSGDLVPLGVERVSLDNPPLSDHYGVYCRIRIPDISQ